MGRDAANDRDTQSLHKDLQSPQAFLELHEDEAPNSHANKTIRPYRKTTKSHSKAY